MLLVFYEIKKKINGMRKKLLGKFNLMYAVSSM